ncbi:MAG: hypothetical protein AVO35_04850 [Candidatus Aegiribacteria sp. MLS_C]|nr:MAG: hypothetical protein AVO35_04850 [Candidatus Aegiribacteria sp. MLS_C]
MALTIILALLVSSPGEGTFELGGILGEPSGISLKYWLGSHTAFDGAVSWSLRDDRGDDLYLHGDFLWHDFGIIEDESGDVPLFYGIGGRVILDEDDTRLGARFPVGFSWLLGGAPLDFFVEIAGVIDLVPDMDFDVNGGIGIRYVF